MTMSKILAIAAAFVAATFSTSAMASTIVAANCVSVTASAGCLFDGNINGNANPANVNSYLNAQNAYNAARNPDITLNFLGDTNAGFPGSFTGAGTASGTWSLPGFLVDFIAVKAGPQFVLYQITPASSGNWDTFDIPFRNNPRELSHLTFFGSQSAVPEPMTWALMIAGFGLVGASMRRRRPQAVSA